MQACVVLVCIALYLSKSAMQFFPSVFLWYRMVTRLLICYSMVTRLLIRYRMVTRLLIGSG